MAEYRILFYNYNDVMGHKSSAFTLKEKLIKDQIQLQIINYNVAFIQDGKDLAPQAAGA
jgi:hypothetical protein